MKNTATKPDNRLIIEPSRGWFTFRLKLIWKYRELLYFLVWRDIKVRYKQTFLGIAWVILQPLISTLIFSGLFGLLLETPSGGIPYPLFVLSGLIVWQYFSGSITRTTNSVVENSSLVTKIYFPRLLIPISAVLAGLVDFFIASAILIILMLVYKAPFSSTILMLPLFLLITMLTALGFGLWLAALNVRFRDVKHLMPFIVQIWMFLTPVIYSATLIPPSFRWILSLNPMTAVVIGFRWMLFGPLSQDVSVSTPLITISFLITIIVFTSGLIHFNRTERFFADII